MTTTPLQITGERFIPGMDDIPSAYAHLHRYAMALPICAEKRVLDIASGEGYGAALLAQRARYVVGADLDPDAVRYAARAHRSPNLTFVQANAERLAFARGAFDVVTCFETLEHFTGHDAFLSAVRHCLSDDGFLIISTPDRDAYADAGAGPNPFHKRELTLTEFQTLLFRYFAQVRIYGQNLVLTSAIGAVENDTYLIEPNAAVITANLREESGQFAVNVPPERRPQFLIALCSNTDLAPPPASFLLDDAESLYDRLIPRLYKAGHDLAVAVETEAELQAALRTQETALTSARNTIEALQGQLDAHHRQAAEYDRQIAARDRALSDRLRLEADFTAQIAERDRLLAERDRTIARLEQTLSEQTRQLTRIAIRRLEARQRSLAFREQQLDLTRRALELDQREAALLRERAQFADFSSQRRMLEAQIELRSKELAHITAQYQNENSYVVYQNGVIEALRHEAQEQARQIEALRGDVAEGRLAALEYRTLRERLLVRFVMNRVVPNKHRFPLPQISRMLERRRGPVQKPLVGYLEPFNHPIPVGGGTAFLLIGWVYHPELPVRNLDLVIEGEVFRAIAHSFEREDVLADQALRGDTKGLSLTSGFIAHATSPRVATGHHASVIARARLTNGQVLEQHIGWVHLLPEQPAADRATVPMPPRPAPHVAICMATYNPPIEFFRDQIETIRTQTVPDWVCIISDDCSDPEIHQQMLDVIGGDARFQVFRNRENLGFYRNFERALYRVPAGIPFVALADQDDHWFPDKLERMLAAFEPDVQLVYSDQQIIDAAGNLLRQSFWEERRNNFTDLTALVLANTITGAASMFRASLLPDLLPFPVYRFRMYHDHWIGCVAFLRGRLAYIDAPLYAYRQHASNVIGHAMPAIPRLSPPFRTVIRWLRRPGQAREEILNAIRQDRASIYEAVYQPAFMAQALLARLDGLPAATEKRLRALARLDRSAWGWLVQILRSPGRKRLTFRAEWRGLRSILSARYLARYYRSRRDFFRQRYIDRQFLAPTPALAAIMALPPDSSPMPTIVAPTEPTEFSDPSVPQMPQASHAPQPPASAEAGGHDAPNQTPSPAVQSVVRSVGLLDPIRTLTAPLTLEIQPGAPRRVNIVLSTIDFRYVYGGYLGMFNLALAIARAGYRTRVLIVQEADYNPARWRQEFARYKGLEEFLDYVEVGYHHDRSIPVIVNPADRFISTSWWTTFTVQDTIRKLGQSDFVYFAQEYEALFHPASTMYAMAAQSYEFPQKTIFSTRLLRDYFRSERIGIYRGSVESGDRDSVAFENAIARVPVSAERLRGRRTRRLLFYARPEEHALRNMFELGVMALQRAIEDRILPAAEWEFHGLGSLGSARALYLTDSAHLQLLPKVPLDEYQDRLADYDIGLSLMLTPHPSLVPLDMAGAGLITVTNTFANKTAEALAAISPNLLGVEPTEEGIVAGLREAVGRVGDADRRAAGSEIRWARDWTEALGGPVLAKIQEFIGFAPEADPMPEHAAEAESRR